MMGLFERQANHSLVGQSLFEKLGSHTLAVGYFEGLAEGFSVQIVCPGWQH